MKIRRSNDDIKLPVRGSKEAAGYDLCSADRTKVWIPPYESKLISTGLSMEIPKGYFGLIVPRSGLASKKGLVLKNTVGIIDSDYRGEILINISNTSHKIQCINFGDRVAQIIFIPYKKVKFKLVDRLSSTIRGVGGFGSTGEK